MTFQERFGIQNTLYQLQVSLKTLVKHRLKANFLEQYITHFNIHSNLMFCFVLLQDSVLIAGVAFKKTFSYAGFEMQPKKYTNPKIALLNIELELKAERDNAEVRVDSVEVCIL